jgi:putative oxidoreductase
MTGMELALLVLRLVVGLTLVAHATQKLFGWFGGRGIAATGTSYERMGLRPGRLNAMVAGTVESVGGLLIALGVVTPVGAAGLIAVMTVAVLKVTLRNGFFNSAGGFEYNLVLAAAAFALAGVGPGNWSLDNALDIHMTGAGWALGALAVGVLGGLAAVALGRLESSRSSDRSRPHPA